ncbi:Ionotropic receptor 93a-like 12, partial [Homarus americanus]
YTNSGQEIGSVGSIDLSYYYTYGVLLRVPQSQLPKATNTQVFVTFLWIYAIVLTIAYCTNLTAFLLVNKAPASVETIRELHDSDLKVAGMGQFYKKELAAASDPYLKGLTNIYEGQSSTEEAYQKVLKGTAVFLQNRAFVEFIARTKFT